MGRPRKGELCDYCGEPSHTRVVAPERWADGLKIHPLKNGNGVICPDCRWHNFQEFCTAVGMAT